MMLPVAAILRAAISQDFQEPNFFGFKERHHFIVQNIGGGQRIFAVVKFDERNARISINKGLLVDSANALHIPNIKSILRTQISRMFGLDFADRLLFL